MYTKDVYTEELFHINSILNVNYLLHLIHFDIKFSKNKTVSSPSALLTTTL
jgi:hypothetical protein